MQLYLSSLIARLSRASMKRDIKRNGLILTIIAIVIYIGISRTTFISEHVARDVGLIPTNVKSNSKQACVQPKLQPFDGDHAKHFHSVAPIKCSEETDWLTVWNGSVFIDPKIKLKRGEITCDLTYFDRVDDFKNKILQSVKLKSDQILPLEHDFFKASCTASDKATYENIHAGVRHVPEYHKDLSADNTGLGLDVLMLGFDSLSHMTYIRKLQKSYKYFTETLKGTVLNGYNIVGDGTPQALIPIFTGKTELELPRTLQRLAKKDFVDVYPMVWKDFREKGYVTAWAEDCPHIGTFTYRMVGFKEQPTCHYLRPFYVTAHKEFYGKNKELCLGSRRRSKVFMDWIKEVYTMYSKQKKFVFGFHSEVSHNDNNLVETADDDLYNLLKYLNEGGFLNKTVVILMSDHGARFSSIRSTLQGKQEERLPFFSFAFPEWFKTAHKQAYENFKNNADSLTSPFDMHPTFSDILDFKGVGIGDIKNRGISLFKEIPAERTCADAGIETHWCSCLNWTPLTSSNNAVKVVSDFVISEINKLTEPYRKLCAKLSLDNVLRAQKLQPEQNMLKFKKTNDADGFRADLSDNTAVTNIVYQVWIYTTPGKGLFEVTVNHDTKNDKFSLDETSISRVNKYGDAPKCIEKEHEELRKYCYCNYS